MRLAIEKKNRFLIMVYLIINLLYLLAGWFLVGKLRLKWLRRGSWSYVFLGITFSSIFFLIGLFVFDIPIALFQAENTTILKEKWYAIPLTAFTFFLISLLLETLYYRFRDSKEGEGGGVT